MKNQIDLKKFKTFISNMERNKLEDLLMVSLEEVQRLVSLLKENGYEEEDDDRTIN